ncbi:MAG: prolyl oligopeptidase family serine peptidase [Verrucomicrobiota bacterium]
MKPRCLVSLLLFFTVANIAAAREWISSDGKKLGADFVSTENGQVKLKRANGQAFTVPLNRLSEADQSWVRLQTPATPATPAAAAGKPIDGPSAKLVTGGWELSESDGLKFAFYGEKNLDAAKKYPLVLALHGKSNNAENGKQVAGWMKSFTKSDNYSTRPCFILAPMSAQPEAGEGMGWNGKEVEQVIKLIKTLTKDLPVDPKRVYIVGHSMGGFGTCHVMASEPRVFAAAIPVAGSSSGDAAELARKPVWLFHAADDDIVPVAGAREFAEQLKQNKQFKFTESPTGGHGVVGKVFEDPETHKWLFEQHLK